MSQVQGEQLHLHWASHQGSTPGFSVLSHVKMGLISTQQKFFSFNRSTIVQHNHPFFHLLYCSHCWSTSIWNSGTYLFKHSPKFPTHIFTHSHLQNNMLLELEVSIWSLSFPKFLRRKKKKKRYFQATFILLWWYIVCSQLIQRLNSETIKSSQNLWNQQPGQQDIMGVLIKKTGQHTFILYLILGKKSSGRVHNKGPKVKEKFESQLSLQQTQI